MLVVVGAANHWRDTSGRTSDDELIGGALSLLSDCFSGRSDWYRLSKLEYPNCGGNCVWSGDDKVVEINSKL